MRAIDTNVVVRFLTVDDPKQAKVARAAIAAGDVFVSATVLLEVEWVLRSGYGFTATAISTALRDLGGIAEVIFEDSAEVVQALDWMDEGMDFADALHLARSAHCTAFVTFDRKLGKLAKSLSPTPVELI